ncbi:type 2 periplasmic-binding domain-containing protein [Paracoccus sp. T5]|uniref:hypothetical protein n=1 Tax=Paracoccus sp. T5 TaxID=3402161 RepID=UPI003AD8FE81
MASPLGASPLFMSLPEVNEKLSRRIIDSAAFTHDAMTVFNLNDHIKSPTTVPGGIYNTTWFLVIDADK